MSLSSLSNIAGRRGDDLVPARPSAHPQTIEAWQCYTEARSCAEASLWSCPCALLPCAQLTIFTHVYIDRCT